MGLHCCFIIRLDIGFDLQVINESIIDLLKDVRSVFSFDDWFTSYCLQ